MYIFLSRDKKKLCAKPSEIGLNKVKHILIPREWKRELFGDDWSIPINNLTNHQKEVPSIKELLKLIPEEVLFTEPEFVDTCLCENCGIPLNDSGTCPICDDGEEDYY